MAEATARLKNYPTSPRKMRYVADMVRGMDVEKAMNLLQHASKAGAKPMGKLLRSAIDNWDKKEQALAEEEKRTAIRVEDAQLIVKTIYVDGGTMLKRWLPAPHGRANKKRKRSNHITIIIDSKSLAKKEKHTEPETAEEPLVQTPVEETPKVATEGKVEKKSKKKKAEAATA